MPKATTQTRTATAPASKVRKNTAVAKKRPPAVKVGAPAPVASTKADKKMVESAAKPAAKTAAKRATKTAVAAKPKDKPKKLKMVRDSFTMPEIEYKALGEVKRACLKAGIEIKKSELLRIGVELVRQMETEKLKGVLSSLTPLKAGRPKKERKS